MDFGCKPGGILSVLELVGENKSGLAYDFRHRFGFSYKELGHAIDWREGLQLISILLQDPSSWTSANIREWTHPATHEAIALYAIYDIHAQVNSKHKPKPYPRPWASAGSVKGNTRTDAREILSKAKTGDLEWQSKHMRM